MGSGSPIPTTVPTTVPALALPPRDDAPPPVPWPGWAGVRDLGHHLNHAGHGDRETTNDRSLQ